MQLNGKESEGAPIVNDSAPSIDEVLRTFRKHSHQLNVLDRVWTAEFYLALAKIMEFRQTYMREGSVFIEGDQLIPVLRAFGAREEDFDRLKLASDHLGKDPTVNYRTIKNGRICMDFEKRTIERLEHQSFSLTAAENYKRHDSGVARHFPEVEDDLQLNSVIQTMLVFKCLILQNVPIEPRDVLDYSSPKWLCTLFNIRTFTDKTIQGFPALEGVHQDGADHTMTTFLDSQNLRSDSGITFLHDKKEVTGIPSFQTSHSLIKGRFQHKHYLDTLIIADNSLKHSVTPVHSLDPSERSTRDMLLFITRKPKLEGHPSGYMDSLEPHPRLEMELPLWLPPNQPMNGIQSVRSKTEDRPQMQILDSWSLLLSEFKKATRSLMKTLDDKDELARQLSLESDPWCRGFFVDIYDNLLKRTDEFELQLHNTKHLSSDALDIHFIEERFRALTQLQSLLLTFYGRATPSYDQSKADWFFEPSYYNSDAVNYDRFTSPIVRAAEERLLAALRLGQRQRNKLLLTSSGMAAFTILQHYVMGQLHPGDTVVLSPYIYFESFQHLRPLSHIHFVNSKSFDVDEIINMVEEYDAKAVFLDPMVNTVELQTIDIRRFGQLVSQRPSWSSRIVVIDGTLVSGGMMLYVWLAGPCSPTTLYYESAHKYIQMGMDIVMCGLVVFPEDLDPAIQLIRQNTGSIMYTRLAALLPPINYDIHQSRMYWLTTNAENLYHLLREKSIQIAAINFPTHWQQLGWRHGCNIVTVRFYDNALNKKESLTRLCAAILRCAESIGVAMTKGAGLGFSITRIFESTAMLKGVDPYLRISVGVNPGHVEPVAKAILEAMNKCCLEYVEAGSAAAIQ